jgi:kumamolisin
MNSLRGYEPIPGREHTIPVGNTQLQPTSADETVKVTLILRRRSDGKDLRDLRRFSLRSAEPALELSHENFAALHGADPKEIEKVEEFALSSGLQVVNTNPAARSMDLKGSATAINKSFGREPHDYQSPRGEYRSRAGLPAAIADMVESVVGLNNRLVKKANHCSGSGRRNSADLAYTKPLTPQQVAALYDFPAGNGANQTIGLYEMETLNGKAGYNRSDLEQTMRAFGGGLTVPKLIDVSVNDVGNSGVSDSETVLDITVAGAIAQEATIAVYFTVGNTQGVLNALQKMIHPLPGDPQPNIISISYGWGPDDDDAGSFTTAEYVQLDKLFQDAANLNITVLASSGDLGAYVRSKTQAQVSYPASEPWVTACGGTTIANIRGKTFDEYVWNDGGKTRRGATGGGVSANSLFPLPGFQAKAGVPKRIRTNKPGRGIPDIAGNASRNSGYVQVINGKSSVMGGTSAVAPLYAGLIAVINANLGRSVGFINPVLYSLPAAAFNDIVGPPGSANNSFGRVAGYPAGVGWNACTGLGSVKGTALQDGLKAAPS